MKQQTVANAIKVALIIGTIAFIVTFTMTSCRSTRYGCPDTWGRIGYK